MINNSHKKYLILSVFFLLLSVGLYFFLYKGITDNNSAAKQADIDWAAEVRRQEEIKSLDSSLKSLSQEKILFDSHFAKSSDIVPFLDTVEQLASKVAVKAEVYAVEQKSDTAEGSKPTLIIGMKAFGSFEGVYKFITLLENAPYELEILSMGVERVSEAQTIDGKFKAPEWNSVLRVKLISFVP